MRWLISTLVALSVLIIMPPIIYHYVYPSWGGDSAEHLIYFNNMEKQPPLYYGQYVVGKILNALPIDMNVSFLWFNYMVFVALVWVVGVATAVTVNHLAGILASILVAFGFLQTVGLFVAGTIFDLVGVGILLPTLLLCLHNSKKSIWWKVGAVVSLIAFALCHINGRYIIALIPIVVVYELTRERVSKMLEGVVQEIWTNRFLIYMMGLVMALMLGYAIDIAKPNSIRLISDAMILVVIILGGVMGLFAVKKKMIWQYVLIALAFLVSIPSINVWFQNNNVVKNADKEAFAYLNSLQSSNVTVSAVVSEDVYELFVKQRFVKVMGWEYQDAFAYLNNFQSSSFVVVRSIPMAFRQGYKPDRASAVEWLEVNNYKLVKEFDCGEKEYLTGERIIVDVYGRS